MLWRFDRLYPFPRLRVRRLDNLRISPSPYTALALPPCSNSTIYSPICQLVTTSVSSIWRNILSLLSDTKETIRVTRFSNPLSSTEDMGTLFTGFIVVAKLQIYFYILVVTEGGSAQNAQIPFGPCPWRRELAIMSILVGVLTNNLALMIVAMGILTNFAPIWEISSTSNSLRRSRLYRPNSRR